MTIKLCVLGSGSSGNAIYLSVDGRQFLVDCGFSKKETAKRLQAIGRDLADIEKVYVTHDHSDHCHAWIKKAGLVAGIPAGDKCYVGELLPGMKCFPLSHDSGSGSVGYTITDIVGNKVAVIMDTGFIPEEILANLFDCAIIVIELNYSIEMLANSPYHVELQERIASSVGHLRDECAAEAGGVSAWPGLKYVVAVHLSRTCINETLARFELESVLRGVVDKCEVVVSSQKEVSKMMVII